MPLNEGKCKICHSLFKGLGVSEIKSEARRFPNRWATVEFRLLQMKRFDFKRFLPIRIMLLVLSSHEHMSTRARGIANRGLYTYITVVSVFPRAGTDARII